MLTGNDPSLQMLPSQPTLTHQETYVVQRFYSDNYMCCPVRVRFFKMKLILALSSRLRAGGSNKHGLALQWVKFRRAVLTYP